MFEFRVTKYDPTFRNSTGAYTRDEWTSFRDIGQMFAGVKLTEQEYHRIEDAYAMSAVGFMQEAGVTFLSISGLENSAAQPFPFVENQFIEMACLDTVIRRVLRGECWFRLESSIAFLHFGWDYYMYVGVIRTCPRSEALSRELGLFVEPFKSPYARRTKS